MANSGQHRIRIFRTSLPAARTALAIAFLLAVVAIQPAQAQTFHVLHTFAGGSDGVTPSVGLTMDRAGNLYGTTDLGGLGYGTVFQLQHRGTGWVFNPLYSFMGGSDGAEPEARVIFGPDGALYSTTFEGGVSNLNVGTVFKLRPSPTTCRTALCGWTETQLFSFHGGPDGAFPRGDLAFDRAGDIYGTTDGGFGVVYELMPSGSEWTESVLYGFSGGDGDGPNSGVIFDNAGNLYGTTESGGSGGNGIVFQLLPAIGRWTENALYNFQNGSDGGIPYAGLIFDPSGNLCGATTNGGSGGGGTVFKLTPSGGSWTYSLLYSFIGAPGFSCGPHGSLVMDGAGNLYGTTFCDGANAPTKGNVFKLTPTPQPPWTYTSLHDFTGGSDGQNPNSNVILDADRNLYGTALYGGDLNCGFGPGCGVVWEITP